ncbi:Uncharacterized protein FWK35_00033396, partial [Aphis craccivora]
QDGYTYRAYAEFQKSYYGRDNVTPLLTQSDLKKLSQIIVVDMSRQNDNVKPRLLTSGLRSIPKKRFQHPPQHIA